MSWFRRERFPLVIGAALVAAAGVTFAVQRVSGNEPREIPVFVFAGQSNMVGFGARSAQAPVDISTPDDDALFWDDQEGSWRPMSGPTERNDAFGPEVSATKRLAARLGRRVAAVKLAVSGSNLALQWNPSTPNSFYAQLRAQVRHAVGELSGRPRIAALFWMQGETDGTNPVFAAAYADNLARLVQRARADFHQPRLPFVLGRVRPRPPPQTAWTQAVRLAQDRVPEALPPARVVDTDDLPVTADHIHYSTDGIVTLGNRFADAYLALG